MPTAEITRTETAERARLLSVDSYDVSLDLTRGPELFGSVCVIRFGCAEPGATAHADLIADAVHEITLNGAAIDPATGYADGRIALPALAARNELRVAADCRYTSSGTGMHRSVDSADGKVYLYTKFEPAYAREVFANFEQPDLKAAFTFHVTAPANWTVLSNQPALASRPPAAGGPTRSAPADGTGARAASAWHFPPTPPISTYLTAIAAGEYHVERGEHASADGQVIPLRLACRASLAPYLDAGAILQVTRQGLDYYPAVLGTPYPFAKYDQVFVPEYSAGATENVGCVILSDRLLFRSRVTATMRELRDMVILHEMAHMWFGDLVTMRWWDDLWLNESFAEFCAALASAEAAGHDGAWTTFAAGRKNWGYLADQLPSAHPVAADAQTLTEAVANFDGISYAKGASVLRQLAAYLGRDAFLAGLRGYLARHAFGNATLADLLAALEASSGRSLAGWADAWLRTAGPNTLRPEINVDPADRIASLAVLQEGPAAHDAGPGGRPPASPRPVLRPHHIAVGLYARDGGGLARTHRLEVDLAGPRTEVAGLAGLARPDLVLLNDDDLSYATVRFDPASLRALAKTRGWPTDPLARAVCWSALIDMTERAELPLPAFVTILSRGMHAEPSVPVLQNLHQAAARMMAQLGDPGWVGEGMAELAAAAADLLGAAEPGSDRQLAWAQLLAWAATAPGQLDLAAGLLDGSASVPGLVMDTELRWALLRGLAAAGRAGEAEIGAELGRDPTDAGRRHAAACRAALPDPAHKAAAWSLLTRDPGTGAQTLAEVSGAFTQPRHAALLVPYAGAYFEMLPGVWASRSAHLRVRIAELLFPHPLASPELLARIEEFLSAGGRGTIEGSGPSSRRPASTGLARVLADRRDIVERALRSRALPVSSAPSQR